MNGGLKDDLDFSLSVVLYIKALRCSKGIDNERHCNILGKPLLQKL